MRARAAVAGWLFVVSAGLAAAQPGPLDRAEQDRRTARVVYDSALLGSELFNKGNHEGCFRLYQGTLLAVQPMLDHRPKLAAFVKDQLERSATMQAAAGAFELRKALDAVQQETAQALAPAKEPLPKDPTTPVPTTKAGALWDRLGGEKVIRQAVKEFVAAVTVNPKVNFTRNGKFKLDDAAKARLEQGLVELVSESAGGPLKYTGKDVAAVHAGMKITRDEFSAMQVDLLRVLSKHNLQQREMIDAMELLGKTRDVIVDK
jgi:hemoglobin